MKKSDFYQKINRNNNSIFRNSSQYSINELNPNIQLDQIWLNDDEITTGVQIIELNSSDNPLSSSEVEKSSKPDFTEHYGSDHFQTHYEINATARERRRRNQTDNQHDNCDFVQNNFENPFYPGYYEPGNTHLNRDDIILNHQMNCFNFIDRQYVGSDSSTDAEYANVQEINKENSVQQLDWNVHSDEMTNYDTDMEGEKRTIWIYSFKNKRLLSESNYELVNIPSRDATSSSCSAEDIEPPPGTEVPRLPTPVPNTYIPRLNLALNATLPTVTEESTKHSTDNQTDRYVKEDTVKQKPLNNWFMSENATPKTFPPTTEKSTSIVNWMALSPRERRRDNMKSAPIPEYATQSSVVQEFITSVEDKIDRIKMSARKPIVTQITREIMGNDMTVTQTEEDLEDTIKPDGINKSNQTEDDVKHLPEDRGDHDSHRYLKKPHIRLGRKAITKSNITDPIEKLDGNNWVIEEPQIVGNDRRIRGSHGDCLSNRLYSKNMCLLKPAEWAEYYAVSGSIPSLNLSLNTDSELRSVSWLKRLVKCFHCFK